MANIRTALLCGFTGVISAGTPHGIDTALKTAIEEGTIPGPRLIAGSRDIGSTGFSADQFVAREVGYSIADILAKCLFGLIIFSIARIKSAEESAEFAKSEFKD